MKECLFLSIIGVATWMTAATAAELETPIMILSDDGTTVGEIPAERHYIPYDALRGDARMGVTSAGHVFVVLFPIESSASAKLCSSKDGGRNWQSNDLVGMGGFGVIADDVLVAFTGTPVPSTLYSSDLGKTWSKPTPVDISPYDEGGGGWTQITQLPDGPALMTLQCYMVEGAMDPNTGKPREKKQLGIFDHVYRSTDGGKTWGDRSLICRDSAESSVILLQSGKMLAGIRRQRYPQQLLPGDDIEQLKAMDGWRKGNVYIKHGFLADSDDRGYTWNNVRLAPNTPDMKHGLCPSDLVQLPDGRVVWIYAHRYGPYSGIMARVSADDGVTWSAERYYVRDLVQKGHVTYATNAVLEDGTILTVCGKNHNNRAIAIRWKLPDTK